MKLVDVLTKVYLDLDWKIIKTSDVNWRATIMRLTICII